MEDVASVGRGVELLAGECACPPEDSCGLENGVRGYAEFLHKCETNPAQCKQAIAEAQRAANMTDWATGRAVQWKPLHFDLARHQNMLAATLAGPQVCCARLCLCLP